MLRGGGWVRRQTAELADRKYIFSLEDILGTSSDSALVSRIE